MLALSKVNLARVRVKGQILIKFIVSKNTVHSWKSLVQASSGDSVSVSMDPPLEESYPLVAGVPSYLLKCGQLQVGHPLILIIPGNPGVADYYEQFMVTLWEENGKRFPVWCLSHAGHTSLPSTAPRPTAREDFYKIDGQVKHKINFVRDHLPRETPLILIGHSIGAYIILHMMTHFDKDRILMAALLFPTIERMATSPKGSVMTPVLRYVGWMASWSVYPVYYLLPSVVQHWLTRWYFGQKNVPECTLKATLKLIEPWAVAHVITMGRSEMDRVVHADHDVIRANLHRLLFYYGTTDEWCPISYYEDMKRTHPTGDIRLDTRKMEHAFCLESSVDMAKVLWPWLMEKVPELNHYDSRKPRNSMIT